MRASASGEVLKKRSISLSGHSTSLALEPEFWAALDAMAAAEGVTVTILLGRIDRTRGPDPLASACRLAALKWALAKAASRAAA
jgi:predicted DNA-binding ribbon-helix-helix protein